jgi:hypothetical protein
LTLPYPSVKPIPFFTTLEYTQFKTFVICVLVSLRMTFFMVYVPISRCAGAFHWIFFYFLFELIGCCWDAIFFIVFKDLAQIRASTCMHCYHRYHLKLMEVIIFRILWNFFYKHVSILISWDANMCLCTWVSSNHSI